MCSQGFGGLLGETYGAAALPGLWFAESYFPAAPGQRASHAHDGVLHVHVLPPEREQFSLPHAGVNGELIEGFEAVFSCCVEQPARLVGGECDHFLREWFWRLHHVGHITWGEMPVYGLREPATQDVVYLANRRGAEPCVQPVTVETLDVRRVELLELQPSEDRLDVIVDKVGIPILGALSHGAVHRSLEPHVKVLPNSHVLVVV